MFYKFQAKIPEEIVVSLVILRFHVHLFMCIHSHSATLFDLNMVPCIEEQIQFINNKTNFIEKHTSM